MAKAKYQLLGKLKPEEYDALKADIQERGVQVPIEVDSEGNVLDGHNRVEIADAEGVSYEKIVRHFESEEEKREHVIKLNLCRRHLDGIRWGQAFSMLMKERGIETRTGPKGKAAADITATVAEIAKELGVSDRTARHRVKQADDYEALPTKRREAIDKGETTLGKELKVKRKQAKQQKEAGTTQTCTVDDLNRLIEAGRTFGTIYADPPWSYGNQATRAATDNHYKTMSPTEIAALPIDKLAAEQGHLHLWTTNAFLFEAKTIMEAWDFKYKSCFVWVKPSMGIGNYWRVSHEFLLLGVRGALTFQNRGQMSWAEFPRGKHSAKPEAIRQKLELVSPGPRLELFARRASDGWCAWGNEISRDLLTMDIEKL